MWNTVLCAHEGGKRAASHQYSASGVVSGNPVSLSSAQRDFREPEPISQARLEVSFKAASGTGTEGGQSAGVPGYP